MPKKSMCMYFSIDINKHCKSRPEIYLGNCVFQFVKKVKYFGVMIHSSMKSTIDVARKTHKFICKQIYCYSTSGIALMMSSVHFFSHIVLLSVMV